MHAMNSLRTPFLQTPGRNPGIRRQTTATPRRQLHLLGKPLAAIAGLFALGLLPQAAHACATCGCTLSTDAATGYSTAAGWRINLDYTFIDQDQLRHGSGKASPAQVVNQPSAPALGGGEIEKDTINRYINASATYRFNADWGVTAVLPYVLRSHATYGTQLQPYTSAATAPDQVSSVHVAGIGDAKILGSYQGFLPTHNLGVQFGIKLPTGHYGGQDSDGNFVGHPTTFSRGPSLGQSLDTSLQAGTGSTDLIVGAYYYQPVSENFDAFVNGQFQAAVKEKLDAPGANYRPGNLTSVSVGLRYEAHADWVPQVQINWFHKSADQGALADTPDTEGTVAYLSPGISGSLSKNLQLYAFVQVPIYSHLQGYQLFPGWTGTVGISMKL
ncbi:transporter [Dyella silvatica]|uniref:transporter n=1 Tax=Dyella silvatica TaxID=2992128 RepID=UPI002254AF11|nr:transporter [Dyella silvatica]